MWRAPNRPRHEISQTFNDGVLTLDSVSDSAAPGDKPSLTFTKLMSLHYEEQRMGIARYYASAQTQSQIERVLRVPHRKEITAQDAVMTEDGRLYRIELVQTVPDVWPQCVDLTLSRIMQKYEVAANALV